MKKRAEIEGEVRALLLSALEPAELIRGLEEVSQKDTIIFAELAPIWAPDLYERDRIRFKPFLLGHVGSWGARFPPELSAWMDRVEDDDEVELFRRLLSWAWPKREQWLSMLRDRYERASDETGRHVVLRKLWGFGALDEKTALSLYELDRASKDFITKHLPWREKKWKKMWEACRGAGDDDLFFALYRQQVDAKEWQADVIGVARTTQDPMRLDAELERRHPRFAPAKIGIGLVELLEVRGEHVHPYVARHLREIFGFWGAERRAYKKLRDLALDRGWMELWGAIVRTCARGGEYDDEIERSVDDRERLMILAGISREYNAGPFGLITLRAIGDDAAVKIYDRWPELLRGPFKHQVAQTYGRWYPKLVMRLLDAGDEEMIDFMAARVVTRTWFAGKEKAVLVRLLEHYQAISDEAEFARRAAQVVGAVPPFTLWWFDQLIEKNALAKELYVHRKSVYLANASAVRDLLEAPEIHAQALAFSALGADDERARTIARDNLDLLLATLLRNLHRRTRKLAFEAILNAAEASTAPRIKAKALDAFDLPDKRYPKEDLIGMIGHLNHRFPQIRTEREAPIVWSAS